MYHVMHPMYLVAYFWIVNVILDVQLFIIEKRVSITLVCTIKNESVMYLCMYVRMSRLVQLKFNLIHAGRESLCNLRSIKIHGSVHPVSSTT